MEKHAKEIFREKREEVRRVKKAEEEKREEIKSSQKERRDEIVSQKETYLKEIDAYYEKQNETAMDEINRKIAELKKGSNGRCE